MHAERTLFAARRRLTLSGQVPAANSAAANIAMFVYVWTKPKGEVVFGLAKRKP